MSEVLTVPIHEADETFQTPNEIANPVESEVDVESKVESFRKELDELDKMPASKEKDLSDKEGGKMAGCQDTGGGGFEWEK